MNRFKNRKYLNNNIKGGTRNYGFNTNQEINKQPYPLYMLPFSTCENNNNKNCYSNNNIIDAVQYWNEKIASVFDEKNNPTININSDKIEDMKNQLVKNIQILITIANKQTYDKPDKSLPYKHWCWNKIKKITKIINEDRLSNMPKEWCKNKDKLDNAIKKNNGFNLEWLSNEDIDNVLYQYETTYPDFKYLATLPIDWQKTNNNKCIIHKFTNKQMTWTKNNSENNFCSIDLNDKSLFNKNIFAMVLNTDTHNKGGQHWFSIYIKMNKNKIGGNLFIYDSASTDKSTGGKYINELIKSIKKKYNLNLYRNNTKSQIKSNSECGMYSIYFILSMLDADHCNNNNSCIDYNTQDSLYVWNTYFNNPNNKIPDVLVAYYRNILFNNKCNNVYDYDLVEYIG